MRTLSVLLFALMIFQCNEDEELLIIQEEKISSEKLEEAILIENEKPTNWPWRGINITPYETTVVNERLIKEFKTQGIDAIRLVVGVKKFCILNNVSIEVGMDQHLKWVEKVIQWCAKEDIVVIIHSKDFPLDPSAEFDFRSPEFWDSELELSKCLSYINDIVVRFNGYENVVAYDFFSEPVVTIEGVGQRPDVWFSFFSRILSTIRVHSDKYVIFCAGPSGRPTGYGDFTNFITDSKVIFGFHFYLPNEYTHQQILHYTEAYTYPNCVIHNVTWDKDRLRYEMDIAFNQAKEHNKLMYVGEFSALRWADGKEQYIEDVLDILEENKAAWCYWVSNEYPGWNMNLEPLKKGSRELVRPSYKTRTRQILENFWKLNGQ